MISSVAMVAAMMGSQAIASPDAQVEAEGLQTGGAPRVTAVFIDTRRGEVIETVARQSQSDPAPQEEHVHPAIAQTSEVAPTGPAEVPPEESLEATPPDALPPEEVDAEDNSASEDQIVVSGEIGRTPKGDPAEQLNAATYKVVQAVDEAVVEPIAEVYDEGIPKPIRKGLGNFLSNLGEPINFLNFLLQLKPGKALKSAGRFVINTTVGVAGLFDVASKKPFNLEHESNGLANTLGFYGIGPGPYLYLPFIGSTTVRDLFGRVVDLSIIPAVAGKPFNNPYYAIPVGALTSLESRIEIDDQIDAIRERCGDPYSATRDLYLIQRQIEIDGLRGKTSRNLEEMIDRLEFNCDIEILSSAPGAADSAEFAAEQTTLLAPDDAEAVSQAAAMPVEQEVEPAVVEEAAPIVEEPAPEPEIRFVSEEVVQPLEPAE